MKNCIQCGSALAETDLLCPVCGASQTAAPPAPAASPAASPYPPAGTAPWAPPAGQPAGPYNNPYAPPTGNPYAPPVSNPYTPPNPYAPPAQYWGAGRPARPPGATGYLVWSIILTLFCTYLGIPALIFSAMAQNNANYDNAVRHVRASMILCIIGTVLTVLFWVCYILFFAAMFAGIISAASSSSSLN